MKFRLLGLLLLATCFTRLLAAQDTASITGTVTDPSGAAIAGARVTILNSAKGVTRTSPTNGSGDYVFAALPIGSYDLTVTAAGFSKYEARGVILSVAEKARVDVSMQVGGSATEITVQGSNVAQVETQSSDLGGVVSGKEISQLELNGRNFTQLATLVPGVSNQSGQDEAQVGVNGNVAFSVNGGRTEYNNWELDGGDNLDNGSNTSLNVYPSIDAIAEFKVLTSNYGAQYGRNGSGTVEVETKSGTSSFHGDVYEFVRNDKFNATPFFQTATPSYKKNDFGYTIGGPIYIPNVYNSNKQKTFFFWSQEWRRDRVPTLFPVTPVPSIAERQGNFSDLCPNQQANPPSYADCPIVPGFLDGTGHTPNLNVIPGFNPNDPTVAALAALIPTPNGGVPGATTWNTALTLPTNWREELFKIDHNFSDKIRASFRYIHDSWEQTYPTPLWTSGTSFPTVQTDFVGPGVSMVARLTTTASPTLLNEFVASYTTDHITLKPIGAWQRPAGMTLGLFPNNGGKVPGIILNGGIYGGLSEDPGYLPNGPLNSNPTYTYRDNVTKIIGSHNLQFGGYFVAAQKNEIPQPSVSTNGQLTFDISSTVSTGNAFADLLLGEVATFEQQKSAVKTYNRYKIFEPYFQDDWHATKRLTLNMGLRISLFGTYYELHHNAYNFDPSRYVQGATGLDANGNVTGDPFNGWVDCGVTPGVPRGCMKGHLFNPAPRLGFAWDPKGDGKWALRGGYGIFFEHTNQGEGNAGVLEQFNPATLTASVHNINGYANIAPQPGNPPPLNVFSIPNKAVWPYIQQWHLDIERNLGRNTVTTVSYVGSKGTHITREFELNQVAPTPLSQNPYKPGEPITGQITDANGNIIYAGDCVTGTTFSGVPVTGQAAINLSIACGANADPFRPFLGYHGITRREPTADSNYNALEVAVRHSIGGLQLNLAYTYSHSIDNSSDWNDSSLLNSYDLNSFRASSSFDQRHQFNLGYVYDIPLFKKPGLTNKLLGGWQWSGITLIQSGTPFSSLNGGSGNGTGPGDNAGVGNTVAVAGSYPDVVGNAKSGIPANTNFSFGPYQFNPSVFVAPRGLTFGDAGRNSLNNPFRTNFDMALLKHFAVTESKYFEFRAEAFNVFNHTEFAWLGGDPGSAASNTPFGNNSNTATCYGGPNNSAGDSSCTGSAAFMHTNAVHNARILQLALKFIF